MIKWDASFYRMKKQEMSHKRDKNLAQNPIFDLKKLI